MWCKCEIVFFALLFVYIMFVIVWQTLWPNLHALMTALGPKPSIWSALFIALIVTVVDRWVWLLRIAFWHLWGCVSKEDDDEE